jgi:hypothetical protein
VARRWFVACISFREVIKSPHSLLDTELKAFYRFLKNGMGDLVC